VLLVAAVGIPLLLPGSLTPNFSVTNNPESDRATAAIRAGLPGSDRVDELLIVKGPGAAADTPAFRGTVERLAGEVRRTSGVVGVIVPYASRVPGLISADRSSVLVPIDLAPDQEQSGTAIEHIVDLVSEANGQGGIQAYTVGAASTGVDIGKLSARDLRKGEFGFGVPAALIILCFVFGTFIAAAIPLLLGVISIMVAMALLGLIGQATMFSVFAVNMITGMGLALGIDYSLFVLSRYREERALGRSVTEAVAVAGATSSRAVFFSGFAFVIALSGMLLTPLTVLRSLSTGAMLVAVVAVGAALTLLPALIVLLGDRVNSWRVPYFGRAAGRPAREDGFWSRTVRAVMRRPVISLVLGVIVLLALASPVLDLKIGAGGVATLPDGYPSKDGFVLLAREFPNQTASPLHVVVEGEVASPAVQGAIGRLRNTISGMREFGPTRLAQAPARRIALVTAPVGGDPTGSAATGAVRDLRKTAIPAAFAGVPARVLVGGRTAEAVDYFDANSTWLPRVFAIVLGLSFILLTVAFRSIVVPIKAIILNLLSVGAAYGLMVLVFQKGFAVDVLGFTKVDALEAWVPVFLFSVLFALSMDYHVFLLSRIRERYDRTGDNTEAVAGAIGSTARLITGAAAIIIAVFIGFALADLPMFQQMGFGVAVSLFIDATLVRSVILPASMKLLGRRNWYLPSWLNWIPNVAEAEAEPPQVKVMR